MESADNCASLQNSTKKIKVGVRAGGGGGTGWCRKALIAFVKKGELDWGDQDSHIDHGLALSQCCSYGLKTA